MSSGSPSARDIPRDLTCHLPEQRRTASSRKSRDCARAESAKPVWSARCMWQTCPCLQGPCREDKKSPRLPTGAVRPAQVVLIPTHIVTAEQHSVGNKELHIKLSWLK